VNHFIKHSFKRTICAPSRSLDPDPQTVLRPHEKMSHITSVIEMAAARAPRGEKLKTLRIVGGRDTINVDVSELREHVWNVGYRPDV